MDPISIAIAAAAFTTTDCKTSYVAMLTYEEIISWFQNRSTVIEDDKNNVAFTLQRKTSDGKYEILQGIFNTEAKKYVDCRSIKPEGVDSRLVTIHATNELVVYK